MKMQFAVYKMRYVKKIQFHLKQPTTTETTPG